MRLNGDAFVIGGRFFRALGIFQGGGKVAELALDGGDFQVAGRGRMMAQLICFVIRVEREIEFLFGLVEIALSKSLRERITRCLCENWNGCKDEEQKREGGSVHRGISQR